MKTQVCNISVKKASCKILVVDNHPDSAGSLGNLLGLFFDEIRTAHTGHRAVEIALQFRPDVMIMDIALPGIDGLEVARRLRIEPSLSNMLLIALTGLGQAHYRKLAEEAGFDDYFLKPADIASLIGTILERKPDLE